MESLDSLGELERLGSVKKELDQELENVSIAILSGKGGVGKTTTALNLGAGLADQWKNTTVLEMDLDTPNLPLELGYSAAGENTVQNLLDTRMSGDMITVINRVRDGMGILPASLSREEVEWESGDLETLVEKLEDCVVIDTPPGVGEVQRKILDAVDYAIIVITPSESAYMDGMKSLSMVQEMETEFLGFVVNRVGESRYDLDTDDLVESLSDYRVLHSIPEDHTVKRTRRENKPVIDINPYCPSAVAYQELASKISGGDYKPPGAIKRLLGKINR